VTETESTSYPRFLQQYGTVVTDHKIRDALSSENDRSQNDRTFRLGLVRLLIRLLMNWSRTMLEDCTELADICRVTTDLPSRTIIVRPQKDL